LLIIILCVLGLLFQAADILVFYYQNDFNGKHYWWSGAWAYFTGLTLMAAYGALTLAIRGRATAAGTARQGLIAAETVGTGNPR